MSASALPWWGLAGVVWLGAIVFFWAICRAAGLADRADEEMRAERAAEASRASGRFERQPEPAAQTREREEVR